MFRKFVVVLVLIAFFTVAQPGNAQLGKPFTLPIAEPPGPSTWLLGQPYGNTIGAFLQGPNWYEAGQQLHFGIDFSMPCGTELVAVADGEVIFVDDLGFGSGPHNLLIRHPDAGLISLYGHLLERPSLSPGQWVTKGQAVALSGDPDVTCDSRPHLHFEVRSLDYFTAYNPVDYIEANWHVLAAIGSFRYPLFQQNLDDARTWLSLDDQPAVAFGGRALNAYSATYPDWRIGLPPANPPLNRDLPPLAETTSWTLRRFGLDGCCSGAWWHPSDPTRLYAIDGSPNQRAAVFEWNVEDNTSFNLIAQAPPPLLSADGTHQVERVDDQVVVRRLSDNTEWVVETQNTLPSFSADSSRLLWTISSESGTPDDDDDTTEIWISDTSGENARMIGSRDGASAAWLDGSRLLVTIREETATIVGIYDTSTDISYVLGTWDRLRNMTIAPGGGRLMFYVTFQDNETVNGIYIIETQPNAQPQKIDWFGAWRWRDADSVFYIPFEPAADRQKLHYYDVTTGENRPILDESFLIANGDWSVSPDGSRIAFWNALDMSLWLIEEG